MSPRNNEGTTKYFNNGETISCDTSFFGASDPDQNTKKVCKVNGYIASAENETFTADAGIKKSKYCHGSTIPYDLCGVRDRCCFNDGIGINHIVYNDSFKTDLRKPSETFSVWGYFHVVCQENGQWKFGAGFSTRVCN